TDVALSVGDDCALLRPEPGKQLAITTDSLVEGVHFLPGCDPVRLGHKVLAVNLSDLAAMGASPAWASLALTLPDSDEAWLNGFSEGFLNLAQRYGVELVGGDTTRGPLSITVQTMGFVAEAEALRRSGARIGDGIYLTGELGLAGLGLAIALGQCGLDDPEAVAKLECPEPRIAAGLALAGLASACIDVSDGLAADLGHILDASAVGASLDWEALPLAASVRRYIAETGDWPLPLHCGDDYELCFTVSPPREDELRRRMAQFGCPCARIGRIEPKAGLRLAKDGQIFELDASGFQHFSAQA
ncbi:MAG: thiamine-phosphate kinase, partial [Methylococcaceae bacterium]|nr:thiamine-phosphate kinase [Methylococcaceae bacterium]